MPETFVYGPHERTFRIELLKIRHTLTAKPRRASLGANKRKSAKQTEHAAGGERAKNRPGAAKNRRDAAKRSPKKARRPPHSPKREHRPTGFASVTSSGLLDLVSTSAT